MDADAILSLLSDLYQQVRAQQQEIDTMRAALAEQQVPPDPGSGP